MNWLIDGLIMFALWGTAAATLLSRDLFRAVVMFIVFGLMMTLGWVRLQATDIALAEAALSAGLTGALMLDTLGHLREKKAWPRAPGRWAAIVRRLLAGALGLGLCLTLALAVSQRPSPVENLPHRVAKTLADSGTDHSVTAVLLNFRSYDTLLEIGVLVLAIVVGLAVRRARPTALSPASSLQDPVLSKTIALLVPLMILMAGYLLWAGHHRPGGAFQAGAILAAAGLLLHLAGIPLPPSLQRGKRQRFGLVLGFTVFLGIGTATLLIGRPFLAYPPAFAEELILLLETALALSIGLILLSLFTVAPPPPSKGKNEEETQ